MNAAEQVAEHILAAYAGYVTQFRELTRGAAERFERRAWAEVQGAAKERILLYRRTKRSVVTSLADRDNLEWVKIRRAFELQLAGRPDSDIAGTFFNGVYRQLELEQPIDDRVAFVTLNPNVPAIEQGESLTRHYQGTDLKKLVGELLADLSFAESYADMTAETGRVAERLQADIPMLRSSPSIALEMLRPAFYRNKGAYLVGQMTVDEHVIPIALAFRHPPEGVFVDAVLWSENHLSTIFSFTRAYFMVDIESPSALVSYLQTLLPDKKPGELFSAIGFYKHGKTEFIRGYRAHLENSDDRFVIAEGIRGQVMMVFSLPSYQTVFKVIKDKFPMTKSVTHEEVRAAYELVKTHDRVGRMADTQEFNRFAFPKHRFDDELLSELQRVAGGSVEITEDLVIIQHLYCERQMTPLNLYIGDCSEFQLQQVMNDYGNAIRELAAANIFPGDMLLKNFGVTRHGRVVFYDYDEICYLTDVEFRELPVAAQGTGAWHDVPEFDVGEFDVFPEEFATFLIPDEVMQGEFRQSHEDLFTAEGWRTIQTQVRAGRLMDVFPYPARDRLT